MGLEDGALRLTVKLYEKRDFSKAMVQTVIELLSDFIKENYDPSLLDEVDGSLQGAVRDKVSSTIHKVFEIFKCPIQNLDSEHKRLKKYTELGLYRQPILDTVACLETTKLSGTNLRVSNEKITLVRVPLVIGLERLLETEGLFEATMFYYEFFDARKAFEDEFGSG
ncbi:hypothetical protein QAD02_003288 [Eretmocerus hayati]|uniref:Uncharacterized protein n=1 Tax=Eretmocerus hayati TaxID=131215 RepID=A0ACC2NLR0_9HYME|nr:hypothetical protein QAD02_003288 [Eretmocerus hayati]